ncbi:hypothetical protein ccrud_12780 [Corynebacterium crudilactis]|uniref:Uncharacterized protein n=1 Tax=Corynebacterium crudilactis TaxID=1652495 RepID=A0A172QW97_9CORY|nr:hypothetical protein ccrud_12780 [Corynebacterium crudilactis]
MQKSTTNSGELKVWQILALWKSWGANFGSFWQAHRQMWQIFAPESHRFHFYLSGPKMETSQNRF